MARYTQQQKDDALKQLRELLKPGATVNCILRHKSRSGMSRSISLFAGDQDITWQAARVLGESIDNKHDGIRMGGCGMDMGFALVYNLSCALYPDGFGCIGDGGGEYGKRCCPSNDHSNGDRDYTPHVPAEEPCNFEHWHTSGGYALRHRWL